MNFVESFKSSMQNVRSNKMRSFLTMLGIIIGISSVITIVSIGQGGKNYITGQFEDLGTNIINVQVKARNNDIETRDYLTLDDAQYIKERIPNVEAVYPSVEGFGNFKTDKKSKQAAVSAITAGYLKTFNVELLAGRDINEHDIETKKNVIVIDEVTAAKFYNGIDNAVGSQIKFKMNDNTINATIIGVFKNPSGQLASTFGDNYPGTGLIPITIADRIFPNTRISQMSVVLSDMSDSKTTADKIIRLLEILHKNSGKYAAQEGFAELETINTVLGTFTAIIGAIAAISLLVGGIGVMNIMLVSVTERTREIGIRMAIGATRRDIRLQFLTESLILCLIGGIIGMISGVSIGALAGRIISIKASVSPGIIALAFLFSSAVGIFFGLYPADKASKLDPIEALRYE